VPAGVEAVAVAEVLVVGHGVAPVVAVVAAAVVAVVVEVVVAVVAEALGAAVVAAALASGAADGVVPHVAAVRPDFPKPWLSTTATNAPASTTRTNGMMIRPRARPSGSCQFDL
jgi:hypothetical protein